MPLMVMKKYIIEKRHVKMFNFHLYIWTCKARKHLHPVWKGEKLYTNMDRQELFSV